MLSLGIGCVAVSRWEDSCKQVFGFPFKYVLGKGFWDPSRRVLLLQGITSVEPVSEFCELKDFFHPASPKRLSSSYDSKQKTLMRRKVWGLERRRRKERMHCRLCPRESCSYRIGVKQYWLLNCVTSQQLLAHSGSNVGQTRACTVSVSSPEVKQ